MLLDAVAPTVSGFDAAVREAPAVTVAPSADAREAPGDASTPPSPGSDGGLGDTTGTDARPSEETGADAVAADARGGTDSAALPAETRHGRRLVLVASIAKSNLVRKVYFELSAAEAYAATGKLPDGALTYVENWRAGAPLSEVFVRQKQRGGWKNGSFQAGSPRLPAGANAYCDNCHRLPPEEHTFGLRFLKAMIAGGKPASFSCAKQSDNAPCAGDVY